MSAPASLSELRGRILEHQRGRLLDMTLAEVSDALPDPEVGRMLAYIGKHLKLRTLGELLDNHDAQRVLDGALSGDNRAWVLDTISAWVTRPSHAPRRALPRRIASPVPTPDRAPEKVEAWAVEHGVAHLLDQQAILVRPFLERPADLAKARLDATATIADFVSRRRLPDSVPSRSHAANGYADAARAYLHHAAERVAERRARETLWDKRPALLPLRTLSVRLKEALRAVTSSPASEPPVLATQDTLVVEDDPPSITTTWKPLPRADWITPVEARIELAGFEHVPIRTRCSCDGPSAPAGAACPHRKLLLEQLLDAVHDDTHVLHPAVSEVVAVPSWQRLVDHLGTKFPSAGGSRAKPEQRLVFRLDREGGPEIVRPAIQKRQRTGPWSTGTVVPVEKIAGDLDLVAPEDRAVVDALLGATLSRKGRLGPRAEADRDAAVVRALVGHPRVFAADAPEETIRVLQRPLTVALVPEGDGVRLEFRLGEHEVPPEAQRRTSWIVHHDRDAGHCLLAEIDERTAALMEAAATYPAVLPSQAQSRVLALLPTLQPRVALALPTSLRGRALVADATPVVRLEPLEDGGLRVALVVRPLTGGPAWIAGEGPELVLGLADGERGYALRDHGEEIRRAESLRTTLGLHDARAEGPFRYVVDELEAALDVVASLQGSGATAEWPEGATPWRIGRGATVGDLSLRVRKADAWFGVEGGISLDGDTVPLEALLAAARAGRRYVSLGKGRFARLEAELRRRLESANDLVFRTKRGLAAGTASADALAALVDDRGRLHGDASFESTLRRLDEAGHVEPELPTGLATPLREYQRAGYDWMMRLAHWGGGALLADEMGLGKTVQALAVLLARASEGPSLVLTPTSVAENWRREAERFAPDLRVIVYQGGKRHRLLDELGPNTLLVSNYDLLARDVDALAGVPFATVVFDEAQALKNVRARRTQAALRLRAGFRVALTGTPVENHLGELWSAFHVVCPGLLGTWDHFRDRYAVPIERGGDEARKEKLRARIRAFLLRRTKAEVAPELPPRTEVVRAVELSPAESLLYETARREAIESLASLRGPANERRFVVLAALTRLRQLACNPRLVDPTSNVPSSKLAAFLELVEDLRRDGHRALVFSQFTSHLSLAQEALDVRGIESLYLDGSTPTKERANLVRSFQEGDAPLFLISLKAGGTGLNLTAADYVIHLDPWWNPAAEDQASDRAHRIGQTRPVTVVRLLSQGTIEDAVVKLHVEKRQLADAVLAEGAAVGKASTDELLDLIRDGATETLVASAAGEDELESDLPVSAGRHAS